MVISKLIGGLGNQMFQYAAGRAIALRTGTPLRLDVSGYQTFKLFPFGLQRFRVEADIASSEDVDAIHRADRRSILARASRRYPRLRRWCRHLVEKERHFHFDADVPRLRGDIYLEGYWQSEKYFADVAPRIRRELVLRNEPEGVNQEMGRRIIETESISVHVRRGDYVSNMEANAVHGTCSLDYYQAAISHIAASCRAPQIFVFSDDPGWARDNLRTEHPTVFVTHNGPEHSHEDLRLMRLCNHHVIANSSFSWWGAWLSDRPGKRVVAPRQWFRASHLNTADLVPPEWTRL